MGGNLAGSSVLWAWVMWSRGQRPGRSFIQKSRQGDFSLGKEGNLVFSLGWNRGHIKKKKSF